MRFSCSAASSRQLHTTLSGSDGTHGCFTLYDVCPHATRCTPTHPRCEDPCLVLDSQALPSACSFRTVEGSDARSNNTFKITDATLASLPKLQPQIVECVSSMVNQMVEETRNKPILIQRTKEKHISSRPAPLVLSRPSAPVMHHVRESTMTSSPRSILKKPTPMPAIYLLTFSTDRVPAARAFNTLINEHLAPQVELLYTIDARRFLVPPPRICRKYSGVADVVQDQLLEDSRACKVIDRAVYDLVESIKDNTREACVAICCKAGTHRSVALAELIALGVRKEIRNMRSGEGVKIVVRHVHRVKGPSDPY